MKSSWLMVAAIAVAILGLLSVILLFQAGLGMVLLALAFTIAATLLLLAAQNIMGSLSEIQKGMGSFNTEESHDFVAAVDSTYSSGRRSEPLATALITPPTNKSANSQEQLAIIKSATAESKTEPVLARPEPPAKNAPLSILSSSSSGAASTAVIAPPAGKSESVSKESYKPGAGLSLSGSSPVPAPSAPTYSKDNPDPLAGDPNRTVASTKKGEVKRADSLPLSPPPPPAPPSIPQAIIPPPAAVAAASVDDMETTQSYLPVELQGNKRRPAASAPQEENFSPEETMGFAVPNAKEIKQNFSAPPSPPVPEPKKSRLRKRYSTFAGLSLTDTGSMDRSAAPEFKIPQAPPPPPPPSLPNAKPAPVAQAPAASQPPISKTKERKRYSTFAGLALNDRSPSPTVQEDENAITMSGNPLASTNLSFSKDTDGLPRSPIDFKDNASRPTPAASKGGFLSIAPPKGSTPSAPSTASTGSAPAVPLSAAEKKSARKRYQTFMGLSLSKTPQPISVNAAAPADATAPLPAMGGGGIANSAAKNIGQQGSIVDGFCSLCGSPQAAGNEYSGAQSMPEFCWYCGAKLRGK